MVGKIAKSASMDADKLSKNSDDDSPQTVALVDHLIMEEILPRLPVKSLIRFKLVCKRWNSTISSLQFAKSHLNFSSSNNRHFIICPYDREFCGHEKDFSYCLLPYRERSNVKDLVELNGGIRDVDCYDIVDSCNGLVCVYQCDDNEDERSCFFTLWNPATREERDIASPKGVHVSEAHGFGYVPSLDDYLIVATFGSGTNEYNKFRGFYVFSVRAGKWKRIFGSYAYLRMRPRCWKWKTVRAKSDEEYIAKGLQSEAVLVGDTMYWAHEIWTWDKIVGFNVVSQELKEYPRLDWQSAYRGRSLELFQVKGCLSLRGRRKDGVSDFWMLKNPGDWSSWQKILSVDLTNISLITFSETGKFLVRQLEEFKLVDPCKEALGHTQGNHVNFARMVVTRDHVESLISPFRAIETGEVEDYNGNSEHHTTDSELIENKGLSLCQVQKVENNTSTKKNGFYQDSDDCDDDDDEDEDEDDDDDEEDNDDDNDDDDFFGDSENGNEDLEDAYEAYSHWETSSDEDEDEDEYADEDSDDEDEDDYESDD